MGVYVKIDDEAKYYQPSLVTDAATDRADEIAVGSDGGSKGFIVSSGVQDTPMSLSATHKNLMEVTQGFCFLLGSFSGIWAGAGAVKLKLVETATPEFFQDFLLDKSLSNYTYKVYLSVVDNGNHIANKELTLVAGGGWDYELSKYKYTFKIPTNEMTFGTDGSGTPLTDLSKVSVYLRGYFYETKLIEYIGGGIEMDSAGGAAAFYLRGLAAGSNLGWGIPSITFGSIDVNSGTFAQGVEFMPKSAKITATIPSYSNSSTLMRAGFIPIRRSADNGYTDYVPISQKSGTTGSLDFNMRTIRYKSPAARTVAFYIFAKNSHSWSFTDKPSWVTLSASSGSGSKTKVALTIDANTSGEARAGTISILDTSANQYYKIPIVQWGIERYYAVENIVSGQAKSVKAYAATIVKHTFDMEVAYYNAPTFNLYLRQIGFNIADYAAGANGIGTLNMKSGPCAGRDFNITNCEYDATHDRWKLTLDRLEDSSVGMVFPNISYPINAGDRFVLTDILMPEVYITVAGKRLLAKARVYYDTHSKLKYLYDLEIDSKWIHGQTGVYLRPGMYMQIADSDLIGESAEYVLIDTVTITENDSNTPTFKVTLREKLYLPE